MSPFQHYCDGPTRPYRPVRMRNRGPTMSGVTGVCPNREQLPWEIVHRTLRAEMELYDAVGLARKWKRAAIKT